MAFLKLFFQPMKRAVSDEIFSIVLRSIGGLILGSIVVFSLFLVGQQLNIIMLAQENGQTLSIAIFSFVAVASIIGLAQLFAAKPNEETLLDAPTKTSNELVVQQIILTFIKGLVDGLEKTAAKKERREAS